MIAKMVTEATQVRASDSDGPARFAESGESFFAFIILDNELPLRVEGSVLVFDNYGVW